MRNRVQNLRFRKAKTGGAQQGGALCGVYMGEIDGNTRTFLAKKEPTLGKNACELAASIIANSLHEYVTDRRAERAREEKGSEPDRSERFAVVKAIPAADLAGSRGMKIGEEKETYVASLFASAHCKDFWEFAYEQYLGNNEVFREQRRGNKHTHLQKPVKRPQFLGTGEPKTVFDTVMGEIVERNPHFLQEFSDVRTVNFILRNLDNHFGNIVISYDGTDDAEPSLENLHLHSIDFAGAFDPAYTKFNELVSPLRNGVRDPQPTNHNDEYSRRWRIINEMAMACDDYREAIRERKKEISYRVAEEIVENFNLLEARHYLLRIMGENAKLDDFDALDDSQKKYFLKHKISACVLDDLENRASEQCEQEAFEIRLSLCFDPIQKNHPESGFKINLAKLTKFFENTEQQDLKKRIRKARFRKIGQEDFSAELQEMTIGALTDWRVLKKQIANADDLQEEQKKNKKKKESYLKKNIQTKARMLQFLWKKDCVMLYLIFMN